MCSNTKSNSSSGPLLVALIVMIAFCVMAVPRASANPTKESTDMLLQIYKRQNTKREAFNQQIVMQWLDRAAGLKKAFLENVNLTRPLPPPGLGDAADDAEKFFLGWLVGFESSLGNLTACMDQGEGTGKFFKKGFKKMIKAFENGDSELLQAAVQNWGEGMMAIAQIMDTCGAIKLANNIRYIVTLMVNDEWTQLLIQFATNIGLHVTDLISDIQLIYYSFLIKDFWNAGIGMGHLFGVIIQV